MKEDYFSKRMAQLRLDKHVSAREMSLLLGQSPSYMNKIENGKSLPSMQTFFYICDFFSITPKDFFDEENNNPKLVQDIVEELKGLDDEMLIHIREILRNLKR